MPEPNPDWFFQPRSHDAGTPADTGDGLIRLPAEVLQRHGARTLDPDTAVSVPGFPPPRSTVYRSRSLLVPANLQHTDKLATYNQVLSGVGMKLRPGPAGHDAGHGHSDVARRMAAIPRPVVLSAAEDSGTPVTVDAWVALQALRAAAAPAAPDQPACTGWSGTRWTRSPWSTCSSARPSPAARSGRAPAASPPARAAEPGPRAPIPTCSAATRAPR